MLKAKDDLVHEVCWEFACSVEVTKGSPNNRVLDTSMLKGKDDLGPRGVL